MGDCEIQCPVDRIDPGQRSDGARVARSCVAGCFTGQSGLSVCKRAGKQECEEECFHCCKLMDSLRCVNLPFDSIFW